MRSQSYRLNATAAVVARWKPEGDGSCRISWKTRRGMDVIWQPAGGGGPGVSNELVSGAGHRYGGFLPNAPGRRIRSPVAGSTTWRWSSPCRPYAGRRRETSRIITPGWCRARSPGTTRFTRFIFASSRAV